MYQASIGAHNHRSHRSDNYQLPDGVRLLSHRLSDAGYFTANIRHLTENRKERFFRGTGKTDWNFNISRKAYDSDRWSDLKLHQPFYAQINFSETHRGAAWNNAHKHIKQTADPAKVALPPYYPDHPIARDDWAQYLNTVMALDRKVGFVLDQLKQDGLAENTVVMFFGDHGRAMVRGKQWCYDSGLRVPLIIYWPGGAGAPDGYRPGTVSGRLVEAIDLTATTLDIAKVDKPPKMQGRVLFGKNVDPVPAYVFGARDRCDETVFRIRTVRSKRYRYIRNFMPERPFLQINRYKEFTYPVIRLMRRLHAEGKLNPVQEVLMAQRRPAEELYDIENDPYEIRNLAESTQHQEVLNRMRRELKTWIETSGDQGRIPEPPEIIKFWEDRSQRNYNEKLKRLREQPQSGKTS
jgi:arylsulfatase A-like enzyme